MSRPATTARPPSAIRRWGATSASRTAEWAETCDTKASTVGERIASVTSRPWRNTRSAPASDARTSRSRWRASPGQRRRILWAHARLQSAEGQRAIEDPSVQERRVEPLGDAFPDRGLSCPGRTIDRDDQRRTDAYALTGTAFHRGPCRLCALPPLRVRGLRARGPRAAHEAPDLGGSQFSVGARPQVAEPNRADSCPHEASDGVARRLEQATDLPVPALAEHDTKPRRARSALSFPGVDRCALSRSGYGGPRPGLHGGLRRS